jgi:hypothetical protein
MPMTADEFVQRLVEVGEVRAILEEHLADNEGELLLHPFVDRVRDLAIASFDTGDRALSDRIVAVFDSGLREGDDRVENAVSVSFVEDTPWWDADRQAFIASWPPALRAEAERQRNWRPS